MSYKGDISCSKKMDRIGQGSVKLLCLQDLSLKYCPMETQKERINYEKTKQILIGESQVKDTNFSLL